MSEPCEHCCQEPTFKAVERQQQPYRGLWQGFIARISSVPFNAAPDDRVTREVLECWAVELWNEQPEAKAAFSLNTTLLGREGEVG